MVSDKLTLVFFISSKLFYQIAQELLEFRTQNTSYLEVSQQEQKIDSQRLYVAISEAQFLWLERLMVSNPLVSNI